MQNAKTFSEVLNRLFEKGTCAAAHEWLERTLVTTNAIENLIGSLRNLGRRVRRWKDGETILRWAGTALVRDVAGRCSRVRAVSCAGRRRPLAKGRRPCR